VSKFGELPYYYLGVFAVKTHTFCTLTSVPNKGEKVPRHALACLIGCAAYACIQNETRMWVTAASNHDRGRTQQHLQHARSDTQQHRESVIFLQQ